MGPSYLSSDIIHVMRYRESWYTQNRREQCDHSGRDWNDVITSQRMTAATRSWKRWGENSPVETPEGVGTCWHLDFSLWTLISSFCPPELWENERSLFQATRFVVICYNTHGKWIQGNWGSRSSNNLPKVLVNKWQSQDSNSVLSDVNAQVLNTLLPLQREQDSCSGK